MQTAICLWSTSQSKTRKMAMHSETFSIHRVGTSGCELRDPDGTIVAWAATEAWALMIASLLNRVEAEGLQVGTAPRIMARLRTTPNVLT